jgi:uncharacterized protein YndB with AHSA1/START domain
LTPEAPVSIVHGEYLEVVEPKRLVLSRQWTTGGEVSRIEIDLKRIDVETEITFTHARPKTEASRANHERGWAGALDELARHFSSERIADSQTTIEEPTK